jgi:cytochrome c6
MKRFLSLTLLVFAMTAMLFARPALAADLANGAKLFSSNCAACHAGGKNAVNPAKTLQKGDLDKYGMDLEAIKTQIAQGKNAMPSFAGRLNAQEIDDVANYVLGQSEKGWS